MNENVGMIICLKAELTVHPDFRQMFACIVVENFIQLP